MLKTRWDLIESEAFVEKKRLAFRKLEPKKIGNSRAPARSAQPLSIIGGEALDRVTIGPNAASGQSAGQAGTDGAARQQR